MKISPLIPPLLVLAAAAFYVFYIDAPERWVSPAAVELSDDGMSITLTNLTEQPITVDHLGFAWKVDTLKHHMLLFKGGPREIPPSESFTETHTLSELGPYPRAMVAAKKHKLVMDIHVDGKRKGGFTKFSRLPVILQDARTSE